MVPAAPARDPLYRGYRVPAEIIRSAMWLMISPGKRWRLYKGDGCCTAESYAITARHGQPLTVTMPFEALDLTRKSGTLEIPAAAGAAPAARGRGG
ncbi:MAG TPA: hypothetical protein VNM48_19440 [Chloroflexota bacterium]|nr:hypothetical protein [Chloroflexota bacterium]